MTTNAVFLDKKLELLKSAGCININISLDSLNEDKFNQITRRPVFKKVYAAILKARDMGFNVKINAVLMKGLNDSEVFDFLEFSKNETIEVRFLEMMRIGEACKNQTDYYISAQEIKERIEQKEKLFPQSVDKDSTSVKYITERGAQIGFIAPESKAFCHSCSRLRLSATGVLRACLMSKQGRNLRGVSLNNIPGVVREVIALKPINKVLQIDEFMNEIGG